MLRHILTSTTLVIIATPAWADWSATAQTQALVNNVDHVAYSCSAPGSICVPPSPNGFTVAYSHDQTSGRAEANSTATDSSYVSLLNHPPYYVLTQINTYANAAADLSRGLVDVSIGASPQPYANVYGGANATATLLDYVDFHSDGTTPFQIGVNYSISGFVSNGAQAYAGLDIVPVYSGSGVELGLQYQTPYPDGVLTAAQYHLSPDYHDFIEISPGNFHATLTVYPTINPFTSEFELVEGLGTSGGVTDLSAHFSFDLPVGVTLTSDSGRLLTTSGTPEPASWAMLVAGFGLVGAAVRRRRVAA